MFDCGSHETWNSLTPNLVQAQDSREIMNTSVLELDIYCLLTTDQ